jgi:hypothetical protein
MPFREVHQAPRCRPVGSLPARPLEDLFLTEKTRDATMNFPAVGDTTSESADRTLRDAALTCGQNSSRARFSNLTTWLNSSTSDGSWLRGDGSRANASGRVRRLVAPHGKQNPRQTSRERNRGDALAAAVSNGLDSDEDLRSDHSRDK